RLNGVVLSAERHKLHIQLHGCGKYSGEQRTFPHLINREGALNLEVLKWSDRCTPDHNVNVAYTRALTGPVDYHLGGFQSVSRSAFKPIRYAPKVLGTRCHHLALYLVYENPMPMLGDRPEAYEGQDGFDFLKQVPTTWDETRFVSGEPGEYVVIARRKGDTWYVGAITNWTAREVELSMNFLGAGTHIATLDKDGSMDEAHPNAVRRERIEANRNTRHSISLAPGGGFVAVIRKK
ncbi:MAG: glycoside hydrolase family 97 catalytic domain-containing protein, partial [Planctomycetaceae bacterium]|nr:glycoside hydrolase family 97 catalytic domain-containing protein [Planctomycetaceae bacterium]